MPFEPADYLQHVFPALLDLDPHGDAAERVLQIVVRDREGCDFSFRLSPSGVVTRKGVSDEVDLTLSFVAADLASFADHALDLPAALKSRRLTVHGDERLLLRLAEKLGRAAACA